MQPPSYCDNVFLGMYSEKVRIKGYNVSTFYIIGTFHKKVNILFDTFLIKVNMHRIGRHMHQKGYDDFDDIAEFSLCKVKTFKIS